MIAKRKQSVASNIREYEFSGSYFQVNTHRIKWCKIKLRYELDHMLMKTNEKLL